jgi:peptide/nickel transport system permease protein
MPRLILRRLLRAVAALLVVTAVVFTLLHLSGDPAYILLTPEATAEDRAAFRAQYGLDRPLWVQYTRYLGRLAQGDFGQSLSFRIPAVSVALERLPATLELMSVSFVFAALIAIPLGVYSAVRQYSLFDFSATTASFLRIAMPVFWFALILQLVFSVNLGWLPTSGRDTIGDGSIFDQVKHLILPAFVLSIRHIAG